ncbi:TPA: type II toxin-antitoxin system RelE/ParE family toxin [Escherichia coli]|nr:type II toxin-antitoxin system RelE/ParE family toxin [Escherichia coli]
MTPNYKPPFSRFVKKARKPFQLAIEDAVQDICDKPWIGAAKAGDLLAIRVYKFYFQQQELLIAYHCRSSADTGSGASPIIDFYLIGPHENCYADLKRYLRSGR